MYPFSVSVFNNDVNHELFLLNSLYELAKGTFTPPPLGELTRIKKESSVGYRCNNHVSAQAVFLIWFTFDSSEIFFKFNN